MGRRRNKRKAKGRRVDTSSTRASSNKRAKKFHRCWIEDCPETETTEETDVDVELLITRVLLFDDHCSSRVDYSTQKGETKEARDHEKGACPKEGDADSLMEVPLQEHEEKQAEEQEISKCGTENTSLEDHVEEPPNMSCSTSKVDGDSSSKRNELASASAQAETSNIEKPSDCVESYKEQPSVAAATATAESAEDLENKLKNARIAVRRHASAQGTVTLRRTGFVHLPNGDCGDGIINPYPDTVDDKYWAQRHRLFRRFEEGIQLDREGWYSVTPEAIAKYLAERLVSQHTAQGGMIVLDPFCGVGGNAIAFALREEVAKVVCVDTNRTRLCMAANNCKVYGVPTDKVLFICGDAVDVIKSYRNGERIEKSTAPTAANNKDSNSDESSGTHGYTFAGLDKLPKQIHGVFLSPPWGGSTYSNQRHFDLESIRINDLVNGDDLLRLAVESMHRDQLNLAYFVPRNTNGWRVGQSCFRAGLKYLEMEQNYLNNKLKTVTLYASSNSKR